MNRLVPVALLSLALVGCGPLKKDKDPDPPAELVDFEPSAKVSKVWATSVGGRRGRSIAFWKTNPGRKPEELELGLVPTTDGGRVYAASYGGRVIAQDAVDGRRYWSIDTKLPLSGGPGVGDGLLVIGSIDGDVVALATLDGAERWRTSVGAEVLAAPAIGQDVVVVRTANGRLLGLAAADGSELWVLDETMPTLSLRGTSRPAFAQDLVWCGFDNGKIIGVEPTEGNVVWNLVVGEPHGRTELARLADVDAPVVVTDNDVFAGGFQGRVAKFEIRTGQLVWSRELSSEAGLTVDRDTVYLADSSGAVRAFRRSDGAPLWTQEVLHKRGLTAPVMHTGYLAVGDFEGYVHWLDRATGDIVARAKTSGGYPISAAGVVADDTLYVLNGRGRLAAFRIEQL